MGWIYRFSGIMEVIYSIENLVNNHTKLILVGEGDLFAEIKKFVLQKDLKEKIVLTGWIPYKDIPDILSIADFCLLPAYKNKIMNDIVPIKIYEYLAMKKPVISSKLPGIMREFGKSNGIIYIDNPSQVIDVATKNIQFSEELGKKGRRFVEDFDWNKITQKFKNFLLEIYSEK
jgi:glycosyltransferase involved in cell wall biosynthesis